MASILSDDLEERLNQDEQESEVIQLRSTLADRDHKLQIQEISLTQATQRIEMLTRQVQMAREMTARAEQAQRDAEADYMLRHLVRDSDDDDADPVRVGKQSQVNCCAQAERNSSQRVIELEEELTWVRDSAETLSTELQAAKDAKRELEIELQASKVARNELELELQVSTDARSEVELQLQREQEVRHKLEMNVKDGEENVDWKAIANVRQELVAVLTAQVKSMNTAKQKLEHAVACCQRSADKRLLDLEKDWQIIEEENIRLRGKLNSLQQSLKNVCLKFREFEVEDLNETPAVEEELERRLAQAQAHQAKLDTRIREVEQKLVSSTPVADAARNRQLVAENNELLRQLEEEHCHSKQLTRSTALFKKSTESALKELEDVEIELRAISRTQTSCDELHETVVSLARRVVADFLEREDDQSVEAAAASLRVQYLTSSMHAHLNRLRALRENQEIYSASISSSDSGYDTAVSDNRSKP